MSSAQDAFKDLLTAYVSPALREQGFKGSAGTYSLPSETHWVLVGFQRDRYGTADSIRFTLNCKVVRRDAWTEFQKQRPYLGDKPKANVGAGGPEWWERIGLLTPSGRDLWWELTPLDDTATVAQEVLAALLTYGLPAMQRAVEATS